VIIESDLNSLFHRRWGPLPRAVTWLEPSSENKEYSSPDQPVRAM